MTALTFEDLFADAGPFFSRTFHRFAEHTEACVEDVTEYCGHDDLPAAGDADADLISSSIKGTPYHAPVIDLDLPCALFESSSPRHYHLYIDAHVPWEPYLALLEAMANCGIVQPGYVEAAKRRGYTSVRHPDKPKNTPVAKKSTPPAY